MDEFLYTAQEKTTATFNVPYGGAKFCWLCLLHGSTGSGLPSVKFFTSPGEPTDGPYESRQYTLTTPFDWTSPSYTIATAQFLTLKTNVWIYGKSLATDTPSSTVSRTASSTATQTKSPAHTSTPTESATASRTPSRTNTNTQTVTPVPTEDPMFYIYNGIPAPEEVLTIPWVDYYPHTAMVGEEITARVTGWHNFWEHDVYFKIGRGIGYADCYGVQEGSEIQKMVNGTIKLRALREDTYTVCYKLRDDWEPLERNFTVTAPELYEPNLFGVAFFAAANTNACPANSVALTQAECYAQASPALTASVVIPSMPKGCYFNKATSAVVHNAHATGAASLTANPICKGTQQGDFTVFMGYNSCSELITYNTTWCGCFLGAEGEHVHMPNDFPLNLILPRGLPKIVEMGCCVDQSITRTIVGTGGYDWGWCSNRV